MTTIVTCWAAIKARAIAQVTLLPMYWQDEGGALPDTPAPFVYFHLEMDRAEFIEMGGGRGSNLFRAPGELQCFVFTPRDTGLADALPYAEHVAAAFRSFRDGDVSIGTAVPQPVGDNTPLTPPGMTSPVNNYSCCIVALPIHFDQVG